jgi:hypothetical protein
MTDPSPHLLIGFAIFPPLIWHDIPFCSQKAIKSFLGEWGIDTEIENGGLLKEPSIDPQEGRREVFPYLDESFLSPHRFCRRFISYKEKEANLVLV